MPHLFIRAVLVASLALPSLALAKERPPTVRQERPLAFGKLLAEPSGRARITIPATQDQPLPNPWSLDASPSHRARFLVQGEPGAVFVIELPSAVEGDGFMLTDFTALPDGLGQLDTSGRATITVGATLELARDAKGPIQARFAIGVRYP